ncbi:unnamed protein product, partial [Prorocentrum cordatum]
AVLQLLEVAAAGPSAAMVWRAARLLRAALPVGRSLAAARPEPRPTGLAPWRLLQDAPCRSFSSSEPSPLEARRKKMLWRAKSRGWLEIDVLMGTFAAKRLPGFDEQKLDLFEEVLELENPDLFKWFTGQTPVPSELLDSNPVMAEMMEFVKQDHKTGLNDRGM